MIDSVPLTAAPAQGDAFWRDLAARASYLFERLGEDFEPCRDPDERAADRRAADRLAAWRRKVARGDETRFALRLELDGISPDAASRAVRDVVLRPGRPLPAWVGTAQALSTHVRETWRESAEARQWPAPSDRLGDALPFEPVLGPIARYVADRVRAGAGDDAAALTPQAWADLEAAIAKRFASIAVPALLSRFQAYQAATLGPFELLEAQVMQASDRPGDRPAPQKAYVPFCDRLNAGGLVDLFRTFPVLARMISGVAESEVAAKIEFLCHLASDRAALEDAFGREKPLGRVARLASDMSDPHAGRTVHGLTFEGGARVIYKPRSVAVEGEFQRLLEWLHGHGFPLSFHRWQNLDRGDRGWVEWLEPNPCGTEAEVERFYRRAGGLLCLASALETMDLHRSNLLAHGEYPCAVDVEMLMSHRLLDILDAGRAAGSDDDPPPPPGMFMLLRTSMVPTHPGSAAGDGDATGLPFDRFRVAEPTRAAWADANSDWMRRVFVPAPDFARENVPRLDGTACYAEAHADAILEGFGDMYRCLAANRADLLAEDGPLVTFRTHSARFLMRTTGIYGKFRASLCQPAVLADGADFDIQLEGLCRGLLNGFGAPGDGERPPLWPLVRLERESLTQFDIPFFAAPVTGAGVPLPDGTEIADAFVMPSFDHVSRNLENLSEADLAGQIEHLQAILRVPATEARRAACGAESRAAFDAEEAVSHALRLADRLRERAVRHPDGSATWSGVTIKANPPRFEPRVIGRDLYGGTCGIALFLAAADKASPGRGFGDLAREALAPIVREAPERVPASGLGGAGGQVYALLACGNFLGDATLREAGLRLAEAIDVDPTSGTGKTERVHLDISLGLAGAVLGLLAAHTASGESRFLDKARALGERLLAERLESPEGFRAWSGIETAVYPLLGFSHGAAGIALALARLASATGDAAFAAGASEGFAYERAMYSPRFGNWPDYRVPSWFPDPERRRRREPTTPEDYVMAWCHGAPGIGLARAGALVDPSRPGVAGDLMPGLVPELQASLQTDLEADLRTALEATLAYGNDNLDRVCCGNFGRFELLVHAGRVLDRPDLLETARGLTAARMAEAGPEGRFALVPQRDIDPFIPGLYTGVAGVGYMLLRLADPAALPSFLLWELPG